MARVDETQADDFPWPDPYDDEHGAEYGDDGLADDAADHYEPSDQHDDWDGYEASDHEVFHDDGYDSPDISGCGGSDVE